MNYLYIILQTLFVYGLICLVLYNAGRKTVQTNKNKYVYFALVFYSIVFGFRYRVGYDTMAYVDHFNSVARGFRDDSYEIGFGYLEQLFSKNGFSSSIFLSFVAFLQLLFVYLGFKRNKEIYPYIALSFMLGCVWLVYTNGIRQELAFGLFLMAANYVGRRTWFLYFVIIYIATLFHGSAKLLYILYPFLLIKKDLFPTKKIQYILFILAIIAGNVNIINELMSRIGYYATLLGYDKYLDDRYAEKFLLEGSSKGLGYVVLLLVPAIVIFFSDLIKSITKDRVWLYNMYFIGILLKHAFYDSPLIQRINYYFYGLEFIVISFLLYTLFVNKYFIKYRVVLLILLLLFVSTLYRMFTNCSAFYFVGQEDLYRELSRTL